MIARAARTTVLVAIGTLLLAEGGLRAVAYFRSHVNAPVSYSVSSGNYSVYDRAFGYAHPPNGDAFVAQVEAGVPVHGWRVYSDGDGNSGRGPGGRRRAARRVYVFGDSFTAMQFRGKTWTHHLEERLRRSGRDIAFVNFARGGYGLRQMMDLAAAKVAEERPDLVLFAFITDDLERARFWRVEDGERVLTSSSPEPGVALRSGVDTYLVDKRIDERWLEQARRDPGEEVLVSLNERFRKLRGEYFRRKLFSLDEGFLLPKRFRKPVEERYAHDAGVLRTFMLLAERGVPYAFLRLPTYGDLVAGRYGATPSQGARLRELQRLTKAPLVDMLPGAPLGEDRARQLFLFPNNGHPTEAGLRFYAETVARRLPAVERAERIVRRSRAP